MQEMQKSRLEEDNRFNGAVCSLSVTELRTELLENREGIDGSKEMLISKTEESRKRRRQEESEEVQVILFLNVREG